jgi:hypothetical protein
MSAAAARALLERTGEHPVVSLYFDLNPERFATAPARATQARALIGEARRAGEAVSALSHDDRTSVEQALGRIDGYLASDDIPVSGAGSLAIFCSPQDDLFETVTLTGSTPSAAFVGRRPHVEPLVTAGADTRWCAVIVSSRAGEVFTGAGRAVTGHESESDYVRGRGERGATSVHTEEQDVEGHLIALAAAIHHDWQQRPFDVLAVGGPVQSATRLRELLHNDLRPALADDPLAIDESTAGESEVRDAVTTVLRAARDRRAAVALEQLGDSTRTARGLAATLEALTERRVQTLLLSRDFAAAGGRCPADGLLVPEGVDSCPADGTAIEPVADMREAAIEAALGQDAEVIAYDQPQDALPVAHPVAALLRF